MLTHQALSQPFINRHHEIIEMISAYNNPAAFRMAAGATIILLALATLSTGGLMPLQKASAAILMPINGFTCGPDLGGTWDTPTNTCTLGQPTLAEDTDLEIESDVTAVIPAGLILDIGTGRTLYIDSGGVLLIQGKIVLNGGIIRNDGTVSLADDGGGIDANQGVINLNSGAVIQNSGTMSIIGYSSIFGPGSIVSTGTITIDQMGEGSGIHVGGMMTNSGIMTIRGSADLGIAIIGIFDNYGTINVDGFGRAGIYNALGTFNNYGTIGVHEGTGSGIENTSPSSIFNNFGTITIDNSGSAEAGINNGATINNHGAINLNLGGSILNSATLNVFCGATFNSNGGTISPNPPIYESPCDVIAPTITSFAGSIADNTQFYFGQLPPNDMTCTAEDMQSGLDGSCTVSGYDVSPGTHTLVATAKDLQGNVSTRTITYKVLHWTMKGFYNPVDMNSIVNTIKAGQGVPLKFEVFAGAAEKTSTSDIASFTQKKISCSQLAGDPADPVEELNALGTGLKYDTTTGQFIANWKTPKSLTTCYEVEVTTKDGSSLKALFRLL